MERSTLYNTLECLLFVAGDPVPITELSRVLELSKPQMQALLTEMERSYREEGRGVQLLVTAETAQLVSSRDYIDAVERLLQPEKTRSVSQSMLETLAVVARDPCRHRSGARRAVRVCGEPVAKTRANCRVRTQGHAGPAGTLWHNRQISQTIRAAFARGITGVSRVFGHNRCVRSSGSIGLNLNE